MSTVYERAPDEIALMAAVVVREFHPQLEKAKVNIDFILAHASTDDDGKPDGPAIKVRGHSAHAYCRIIPLKDRAMGRGDAEIVIDGDHWGDWSEAEQRALLDHELYHLQVRIENGVTLTDDCGRPKLKMRLHDHEFGWFQVIAQRHGAASFEMKQATSLPSVYFQPELFSAGNDAVESLAKQVRSGSVSITIGATEAQVLRRAAKELAGGVA